MNTCFVGCPVRNRAWILPRWFDATREAFAVAGIEPVYVFAIGDSDDDTRALVEAQSSYSIVTRGESDERPHQWNAKRFAEMAGVRNQLLGVVREHRPDYFLSVDSDILLAPETLVQLLETVPGYAAVGGKCYMTPRGRLYPSYGMLQLATLRREDSAAVLADVDVVMALKLMTPAAYNVDYRPHDFGEDVGWSVAVRELGGRLAWDGRTTNAHVMEH